MERCLKNKLMTEERPKHSVEYYATGTGFFPIDMLRYDACWPASSEDAAKIEWGFTDTGNRKQRSVRLRSYREPTIDRWSSFCWSVGTEKL
jgi:hypothetical protein